MNWPVTQESYGSFDWLRKELSAVIADFPNDVAQLDHEQRSILESIIESGIQQFYYPDPLEIKIVDATEAQKERLRRGPYSWSFLQDYIDISIVSGTSEYALPTDFANFIGEPIATDNVSGTGKLSIADESHLRQLIAVAQDTGNPKYAAVRGNTSKGTAKDTHTMLVYPIPAANETIRVKYAAHPPRLSDASPWPFGGQEHAQTILACCLAVYEERAGTPDGPYQRRKMNRLAASISLDQQSASPTTDGVWPEVADGKLGTRIGLEKRIGLHLGYGPNRETWAAGQTGKISEIYREAMHLIANPPIIPGMTYPHQWSWLTPKATIATVADTSAYDLPADFAFMDGPLTIDPTGAVSFRSIRLTSEHEVRNRLDTYTLSGIPELAAIRVKSASTDKVLSHAYEILLWPAPSSVYTISYRYRINPDIFDQVVGSAPGAGIESASSVHGRMFMEACLVTADRLTGVTNSGHELLFGEALVASVKHDLMLASPDTLGKNRDRSADGEWRLDHRDTNINPVVYTHANLY